MLLSVTFSAWLFFAYLYFGQLDFGTVILAAFESVLTIIMIYAIKVIVWRKQNEVDLFANLETDPEKVKEHMLFIMQYGHTEGIKGSLKEFNDIFRNYPQWELENWEVFRAWYKDLIDHAIDNPEIYTLKKKDGSPYNKTEDPLYDPDASDWEQFDRPRFYDDEENDDDDDYTDNNYKYRKSAEEGFYTGIGLGATDNFLNK